MKTTRCDWNRPLTVLRAFPRIALGAGGQLLEFWHMVCATMQSRKKVDRNAQFGARIGLTIPPLLTDCIGGTDETRQVQERRKFMGYHQINSGLFVPLDLVSVSP
jgi:hypothetical protein